MSRQDGPGRDVPLRRLAARTDAVQDRFGVLLTLLVGSFVTLGSADNTWARVVAGYGLAAVVYLFVGHAIANRVHRH